MQMAETTHTISRKTRSDKTGRKRDLAVLTKPFVGWDGEGYNVNGKHYYGLFGNSLGQTVHGRLDWRACLRLLMESPNNAIHVIYSGTYDVVMMFRNMPQVLQLLHGEMVHIEQYRIHFLRGKMLRVTDRETKQTRTLYDVFSFFGSSFVKACQEYLGNSPLLEEIAAMKEQRNEFTESMMQDASIETYMNQELAMLVQLCEQLREMLAKVNITPSQWHGPGAVASSVLRANKIGECKGTYTPEFRRLAEAAYYGGRFEQFQRGRANGTVYQYDIRSAYPNAMRHLVDLSETEWVRYDGSPANELPMDALVHVRYHPKERDYRSPGWLPHRSRNGSIYFPDWVDGWYWNVEVPDHLQPYITQYYYPERPRLVYPFRFVEAMYEQRAKLKAAKQPHQLALKLALNSLYGKVAQSRGARMKDGEWQYPTYHESVWAGFITAYTRRMIAEALHTVPFESLISTETDSVLSLEPLPTLELGGSLGDWEMTTLEDMVYLQSGVALYKLNGEWKFKTRGFTMRKVGDILHVWESLLREEGVPTLTVEQTRFVTDPRQKNFGQWVVGQHRLTLGGNPLEKRIHIPCEVCDVKSMADALHPLTVPPIPIAESTPYAFLWRTDSTAPIAELDHEDITLRMEFV